MNSLNDKPIYKLDCWNPWTSKSAEIPFKEGNKPHGEDKLGAEFDTDPYGQNSTHDLNINNEKWEAKKLDKDGSFNLGVEAYSQFVLNFVIPVISLFKKLDGIEDKLISTSNKKEISKLIKQFHSSWRKGKKSETGTTIHNGLPRGEVSESNLDKLNDLIESLKLITDFDNSEIELYSSTTGRKYPYSLSAALQKVNLEKTSYEEKSQIFGNAESYDQIYLCSEIHNFLKEFKNISVQEKLTLIVRSVFDDVRLVLVDEQMGYKPIEKNIKYVTCYRITRKTPRCKYKEGN